MTKLSLLFLLLSLGCSSAEITIKDDSLPPIEADDQTGIISGCGHQPVVGYTYCRITEGTKTKAIKLRIHAPMTNCKKETCTFYSIFRHDGLPTIGGNFPRDKTLVELDWETILRKPVFEKSDRGFYGVRINIKWVNAEGFEKLTVVDAEVRLRVLPANYVPLNQVPISPYFKWEWEWEDYMMRMTDVGRSYAGEL